jgi:hypothetical protein
MCWSDEWVGVVTGASLYAYCTLVFTYRALRIPSIVSSIARPLFVRADMARLLKVRKERADKAAAREAAKEFM